MAVPFFKRTRFEELEACGESQVQQWDFNPKLQVIWRRIATLDRAFNKALVNFAAAQRSPFGRKETRRAVVTG